MSGPKCASYWTDVAMVAAARRRAAAAAERESLATRIEELELVGEARRTHGLSGVFDLRIAKAPGSAAVEDVEAWNSSASEAVARAEKSLAEAERSERQQYILDKVSEAATGDVAQAILRDAEAEAERHSVARQPRARHVSSRAADATERSAAMAALIEDVPAGISAEERDALEEQVMGLAQAPPAEFGSRLVAAKAEMQRVGRAAAQRAETRQRARELLGTLHGLDGTEVDACRALLRKVIADETSLLNTDVEAVQQARSTAEADYERQFVASQIEAAFRESGLEVGSGFATEILGGEETYAASRSSSEHAVAVRLREGLVDLRLVRAEGSPDAQFDADAEGEFCKDFGRVSAHLHEQGVQLELVSHQRPGAVAVDVVPEARQVLAANRRRRPQSTARVRSR